MIRRPGNTFSLPPTDVVRHISIAQLVSRPAASKLGIMPAGILLVVFILIMVSLGVLVRWEYRKLVRGREARLFDRLHNSQF